MSHTVAKPAEGEYAPFYAGYVALVTSEDVVGQLRRDIDELSQLLAPISDERASVGYGPGKWTLKEVILHMSDAERVFSLRTLRVARGDETPLPWFEQDHWVPNSGANDRSLEDLLAELDAIRLGTIALVKSLTPEQAAQVGMASGKSVSARALAYITCGHARHHTTVIRERYLV
jgi:hypothetical protein